MFFQRAPSSPGDGARGSTLCGWFVLFIWQAVWLAFGVAAVIIGRDNGSADCLDASANLLYPSWMWGYGAMLLSVNSVLCVSVLFMALETFLCMSAHRPFPSRLLVVGTVLRDLFLFCWWIVGIALWDSQIRNSCADGPLFTMGAAVIVLEAFRLAAHALYCFCFGHTDANNLWHGNECCGQ